MLVSILQDSFHSLKMSSNNKFSQISFIEMFKKKINFKKPTKLRYAERDSLQDLSNQTNRFLQYFITVKKNII